MCRRIACRKCGKPTWAGCGAHVEQVIGDVPHAERCKCRDAQEAGKADRPPAGRSGLSRLFDS